MNIFRQKAGVNCIFGNNRYGIYISKSNNTLIDENKFYWTSFGTQGVGVSGRYANGLYVKNSLFYNIVSPLYHYECTDVVEEDNIIV